MLRSPLCDLGGTVALVLWIAAVLLVVVGIVLLLQGSILLGILTDWASSSAFSLDRGA